MKLVLFDIDGTLIYHVGKDMTIGAKYRYVFEKLYGRQIDVAKWKYHGHIDRSILLDLAHQYYVLKEDIIRDMPLIGATFIDFFKTSAEKGTLIVAIPEAARIVRQLSVLKDVRIGIITGNMERLAHWKLRHVGIDRYFHFGLYGEEADDRIALAKKVFLKAQKYFKTVFAPGDITIIGDTIHDVRCGKAIGAYTIAVTTGGHQLDRLKAEAPDMLVESLADSHVLTHFDL